MEKCGLWQAQAMMYSGYANSSTCNMDPAAYGAYGAPYGDPSSAYAQYGMQSGTSGPFATSSEALYQPKPRPSRRPAPAPAPEPAPEKPKLEPPTVNVKVPPPGSAPLGAPEPGPILRSSLADFLDLERGGENLSYGIQF